MGLTLITAPTDEPIGATDAITHLRLGEDTDEDALLNALIVAAREHVEAITNRVLLTQTWELTLDYFPRFRSQDWSHQPLRVPKPPLQSVTSIKYLDMGGTLQTLANTEYTVDTTDVMGRIVPAWMKIWPITRDTLNAVTIRFVCGYGDAAAVPSSIKQAMLLLIGGMYENRESQVTQALMDNLAVQALLSPYRALVAV